MSHAFNLLHYDPSKYIASIISPLAGKTGSFVKNSGHFIEMIKTEYIKEDEIMVSFDVVSLFTNVPIQESIQIIQLLLPKNEELENRTELSVEIVSNLLELCLSSIYFCYKGFFTHKRRDQPWVPKFHLSLLTFTWNFLKKWL